MLLLQSEHIEKDSHNIMKEVWKGGTMIYPLPAVMVTCGDDESSNIVTVAWTGTLCTDPPMCYISLRPSRYSYDIIKERMEFTINLTTSALARATDWAGVKSGRDFNKWEKLGLTPDKGVKVSCPSIKESPLSIECRVREIVKLGTHDMFIADVLDILADQKYIDRETGKFKLSDAGMLTYCHGAYYELGGFIGRFGFSVKKK